MAVLLPKTRFAADPRPHRRLTVVIRADRSHASRFDGDIPMRASAIQPLFAVSFLICPHPAAKADFALLPSDQVAVSPPATSTDASPSMGTPTHPASLSSKKAEKSHSPPKLPLARGFGRNIPLSFAVRQIVPSPIKVTFARESDRDARVDWRGGRAWPSVLRDSVRPLGLRVVVRERRVSVAPR